VPPVEEADAHNDEPFERGGIVPLLMTTHATECRRRGGDEREGGALTAAR
jgi:hypothetical protein